jgi:hypothetical protein
MIAVAFQPLMWTGSGLYALAAIGLVGLLIFWYALRAEIREHPYGERIGRFVLAFASAAAIAYTYLIVYDGVLYNCEYAWWTLECWLWS